MHILLIPVLRTLSDGKFHSGTLLAEQYGVSRASICNVLKNAGLMGINVHKVRGRGYQLPTSPDWLDTAAIQRLLNSQGSQSKLAGQFSIELADRIDSTNAALLRATTDATHLHCLVAEIQYAGRGRRGQVWQSTLGGSLTCSIRWCFSQGIATLAGLSLAVAVALLRTLHQFGIADAQLKWPNDVLWQYRKLAGILIEVHGEANGPSVAIIGIGINLHLPPAVRANIDQAVTDVAEILGHPIGRNELLATLLYHLNYVMAEFELRGLTMLRHEWQTAHAFTDKQVRVLMANGSEITGQATGLANNGALLLRTDDDKQIAINSGEVQFSRRFG